MERYQFAEALEPVRREIKSFMKQHGEAGWQMIMGEKENEDSYLRSEVMWEILDKMLRVSELIGYLDAEVEEEGKLETDADGWLVLNHMRLHPGQEIEVYIYEPLLKNRIWTRVRVGVEKEKMLVGIGREVKAEGLRARIRYRQLLPDPSRNLV